MARIFTKSFTVLNLLTRHHSKERKSTLSVKCNSWFFNGLTSVSERCETLACALLKERQARLAETNKTYGPIMKSKTTLRLICGVLLAGLTTVQAVPTFRISDGVTTIDIADNVA